MSKKTRSEKEIARLRRDLELLRSRLKHQEDLGKVEKEARAFSIKNEVVIPTIVKVDKKPSINSNSLTSQDFSYIKKDLFRTGLLSLSALSVIFALYLLQTYFPKYF